MSKCYQKEDIAFVFFCCTISTANWYLLNMCLLGYQNNQLKTRLEKTNDLSCQNAIRRKIQHLCFLLYHINSKLKRSETLPGVFHNQSFFSYSLCVSLSLYILLIHTSQNLLQKNNFMLFHDKRIANKAKIREVRVLLSWTFKPPSYTFSNVISHMSEWRFLFCVVFRVAYRPLHPTQKQQQQQQKKKKQLLQLFIISHYTGAAEQQHPWGRGGHYNPPPQGK